MPIYDFICEQGKVFEAIIPMVKKFDKPTGILCKFHKNCIAIRMFTPTHFIPFRSFTDYDMTGQPIEIGSPKQLSKELHKRGLEIADRPLRHKKRQKFGLTEKTKIKLREKLGKEIADATA